MSITRATFPESIKTGLRKWIIDGVSQYPDYVSIIANMDTSERAFEFDQDYAGLTKFADVGEGGNTPYEDMVNGYKTVYTPKTFKKGTQITREAKDDDLYADGPTKRRMKALGESWIRSRNSDFYSIFRNGFNTAFTSYGDNLPLFSTVHTVPDASFTQSNASATGAQLTDTNLETAILQLQQVRDFQGELEDRGFNPLILMVPPALRKIAKQITESERVANEFSNTINVNFGGQRYKVPTKTPGNNILFSNRYDLKVLINPWLDARNIGGSDTAWYLIEEGKHEVTMVDRMGLEIHEEADNVNSHSLKMSAMGRYAYGWSAWKSLVGSKGDDSAYAS